MNKLSNRQKIKYRIRRTVKGTADRPRMTVTRSNKHIYVQLIDDATATTLLAVSSTTKDVAAEAKGTKTEIAALVGKAVATKAVEKGISAAVFDRNGYLYHGRVKQIAESARENGLKI